MNKRSSLFRFALVTGLLLLGALVIAGCRSDERRPGEIKINVPEVKVETPQIKGPEINVPPVEVEIPPIEVAVDVPEVQVHIPDMVMSTGLFGKVQGSGNLATESRAVSDFDEVALTGIGNVTIRQSGEEALKVTADDNLLPYIETEVKDGVLVIGVSEAIRPKSLNPSKLLAFDLQVKELESLQLAGVGNFEVLAVEADRLEIILSGAGDISVDDLEAEKLAVRFSGIGNIELAGKVIEQEVVLSGLGNYNASDLESEDAAVAFSGAGSAGLWAAESLDIQKSGLGDVDYYGSPMVSQHISGLGKVNSLGEK